MCSMWPYGVWNHLGLFTYMKWKEHILEMMIQALYNFFVWFSSAYALHFTFKVDWKSNSRCLWIKYDSICGYKMFINFWANNLGGGKVSFVAFLVYLYIIAESFDIHQKLE